MSFHIKKIKILNFLSFFGDHEVKLKPFTSIICNFDQGKEDFFKAILFVFGVKLSDINIEDALDLISPMLNETDDESSDKECYVEVVLQFVGDQNDLQMRRAVTNEVIKHYISNVAVSIPRYEEELDTLGLNVKNKNLIFYGDYFNDAIWGTEDDLEKVVTTCLREPFLAEEWEKLNCEVKHLDENKKIFAKRKYNVAKKEHVTIAEFVQKHDDVLDKQNLVRENCLDTIAEHPCEEESEEISPLVLTPHDDDDDDNVQSEQNSSDPSTQTDSVQSEENSSILSNYSDEMLRLERETERNLNRISELEAEREMTVERYNGLKELLSESLAKLYHREIKEAKKSENMNIIQDRIRWLKGLVREEENHISTIWRRLKDAEFELEVISKNIHDDYGLIQAIRYSKKRKGRLSPYGRLADHVRPSQNFYLLKRILGEDLFYSNLVDTYQEEFDCRDYLQEIQCELRETFIVFEDEKYHRKLKDTILLGEENGIDISTFEKLQIFLCKLKTFGLISEMPILVTRKFDCEMIEERRDNVIIFTRDGIILGADGSISRIEKDEGTTGNEEEIIKRLNKLILRREVKFHEICDLHFRKWETFSKLQSLEDDIYFLKRNLKRRFQDNARLDVTFVPTIYDEYMDFFVEHDQLLQEAEVAVAVELALAAAVEGAVAAVEGDVAAALEPALQPAPVEPVLAPEFPEVQPVVHEDSPESSSSSSSSQPYDERFEEIQNFQLQLEKTRKKIVSIKRKIRLRLATSLCFKRFPVDTWVGSTFLKDKPTMVYERELAKLRKVMSKEDIDEFKDNQEWRLSVLNSLCECLKNIKKELKDLENTLQEVTTARKTKLIQLIDHCSKYFFLAFQFMLDGAVSFLEMDFSHSENKLKIVTSLRQDKTNLVDIKNLNTFFKFVAVLSLFLEISIFEKLPLMILDNVDNFFPRNSESVNEVLSQSLLNRLMPESENLHFDLMMRIGEYLSLFRRKNTTRPPIRRNKAQYVNGPSQVFYFASSDLSLAAEHHVLINRKILPSEYITEKNVYFSTMQSISF